jgi:hypothetical protein
MPSGDVEQLLHGIWLITTELMHQGFVVCARPECRDDIGVADLGELMALLGETLDVILQGFTLLLPATLHNLGVARPYVCALKGAGEDLLEIHPGIDRISRQLIQPGPGRVSQVNREELDDEEIDIHPAYPTHKAVVQKPNTGIGFAIVFDDIIWR